MKRTLRLLLIAGCVAAACLAEGKEGGESGGSLNLWKWANFVVLAAGLGYLAGKNAGPFFDSRARQIRKDIVEGDDLRTRAENRLAEVERRLASLESDIAQLRDEAQREGEAETERLARHSAGEIAKIQAHAQREIDSAGKAARVELKRYAAELAVTLAERQIRARMTPETKDSLVRGFVRDLQ